MENKKKDNKDECQVTESYKYTRNFASYFCKIEEVPQPPVSEHPKGWSPNMQKKLDKLKLKEAQQEKKSDK